MVNKSITSSNEILLSARQLILAGGYNGFSYADIADIVGIRKASIHYHFPNKSGLVRTLVANYRKEAESGIADLERHIANPAKQLHAYIGYWEACIADATAPLCVCALLASQMPALPKEVALEVRKHFRMLSAWLASVFEHGEKTGVIHLNGTAQSEAETFMATVHGAMFSARAYGDTKIFGSIMHPMLKKLLPVNQPKKRRS